jgi:hypothetical protein
MKRVRAALVTGAAGLGLLGVAVAGFGGPPAAADYAPFVVLDPTSGPPGTVVTASSDGSGRCGTVTYTDQGPVVEQPGTVVVELGTLPHPPDIGMPVTLVDVLATTTVAAGPDGLWTAQLTIPADAAPGKLWVTGHCEVSDAFAPDTSTTVAGAAASAPTTTAPTPPPRQRLFDYFPAVFTVTGATTTSAPTTTVIVCCGPPAPAPAVEGTSSFTG